MSVRVPTAEEYADQFAQLLPPGQLWELADLAVRDDDLLLDDGLVTSGLMSLLLDARAEPEDMPPDPDNPRGYWADEFSPTNGDRTGNKLWLLDAQPARSSVAQLAEQYAREGTQWYLDDGIAESVNVAALLSGETLSLAVEVVSPTGDAIEFKLRDLWNNTEVLV